MSECYGAVMRETVLNQNMAIESSHFRNGKYSDRTEGMSFYGQDFPLCDIGVKVIPKLTATDRR